MDEPITSLASFKRRLAASETVSVINHIRPKYNGPRRIVEVGATLFWWTMPATAQYGRCRTDFPKATGMTFDGPDQVTFMQEGAPFLTFTFDNPEVGG